MLPLTSIVDLYIEHGVTNHTYFINEYELNTSKFYIFKGNSSVKINFFYVKGLIFSLRFLLVIWKNCVTHFRISLLK